jgi:S-DNA-T family DNA segregation ATPase FtsK/SpoIIIE
LFGVATFSYLHSYSSLVSAGRSGLPWCDHLHDICTILYFFWLGLLPATSSFLVQDIPYWSFLSGGFGYELGYPQIFSGLGYFYLIGGALLIFVVFFFDIDKLGGSAQGTDQIEIDCLG